MHHGNSASLQAPALLPMLLLTCAVLLVLKPPSRLSVKYLSAAIPVTAAAATATTTTAFATETGTGEGDGDGDGGETETSRIQRTESPERNRLPQSRVRNRMTLSAT